MTNDESVPSALYVVLTLLMRVDSWLDLPFAILYGICRTKFPKIFKSLFNHEWTSFHEQTRIKGEEATTCLRAGLRHGRRMALMTGILARSALERKSSVGATLLYGVRRPGAALGFLKQE